MVGRLPGRARGPDLKDTPPPRPAHANKFNFLRFAPAGAVVLEHAFELLRERDPFERLFGHGGRLGVSAVSGFFLISGSLIVASWQRSPSLRHYLARRCRRINPGFAVAYLVSALIVGPLGGNPHHWTEFAEHDAFLVGRSPEVQFRRPLKDKTLSRVHFLVEVNPPSCRQMDMASTNGVRINGKLVTVADRVDGDTIRPGRTAPAFAVAGDEADRVVASPYATMNRANAPTADANEFPEFPGYRVARPLGEGGMGVVYLAHRVADAAPVALKVVRPAVVAQAAIVDRFLREASLLRKLEHPGIVRFLDIGHAGGRLYFAMRYVAGPTAAGLLQERGPLPIPFAVGLIRQVLRALAYAHGVGSVHRDVKPANILTTGEGGKVRALLADFGLTKLYHESSPSGLSLSGQIGGTLASMPPEQITQFRDARPPADLYAVGATRYMLLTGQPIFRLGARPEHQVSFILFAEPDPIRSHRPEIPADLAAVIHQALAKSPADRFPDAGAMGDALAPFAQPSPGG